MSKLSNICQLLVHNKNNNTWKRSHYRILCRSTDGTPPRWHPYDKSNTGPYYVSLGGVW